jgi:hypothetical protein
MKEMEQTSTNMKFIGDQQKRQKIQRQQEKHIEWRRDKVFELSAKGYSQAEISRILDIPKANVCRDIQFLKKLSQEFVFDLAKDLGFYYKGCILTMDQIQKKSWDIFNDKEVSQKDKLLALKVIKETSESKFFLLEKGPSVMALNSLQERVEKIESSESTR